MDLLEEYQRLKAASAEADIRVVRAEERLQTAKEEGRAVLAEAKEKGFESGAELAKRKEELEAEVTAAIEKVKEALS